MFRNDATNGIQVPGQPAFKHSSQGELTLQLAIPSGSDSPSDLGDRFQVAPAVLEVLPTQQYQSRAIVAEDLQAPPPLGTAFETFEATTPVSATPVSATPVSATTDNAVTDEAESQRVHRITDGDTLQSIAERYLGDRTAWPIIVRENSTVLVDPDVLPIGTDIQIPDTVSRSSGRSEPTSDTNSSIDDGLVPIPAGLLHP
ncbi:MAG: LysM peptidoglycan-binding domain-containing protein [Planctomycetaceae bacterium]|nr:LysM peptidoglycan-binding domain-containing protein [Planctomycetales bacterium]MCB9927150.1 LysM peptidoglycan-binding domain-containing protein [Planctomycetaceae bacterium]